MIGLIARRELLEFIRDRRLFWAGGIILLLLAIALLVGWQQQRTLNAERAAAQQLDYDDWVSQAERHPHDAAHQGMHVFKPEAPLAVVDPGITPYVGSTQWLQAHRQADLKFVPAQDATGLQRFGNLSVAWVLQVLGPLLVIVLGFNAFAAEREQGTLRQLMSIGVTPQRLLLGKALALSVALALLLVPAAVVIAFVSLSGLEAGLQYDTLMRLLVLFAGYAIYLSIFIFLTLAVSGRTSTSRIALMALMAVWITGVILAPRAISDLADRWYPTPSRVEFNNSMDQELSKTYADAWQASFGVSTRWGADLPLNRWGEALQVDDQAGYLVADRHFAELWGAFDKQRQLQEWSGLVFPVLALRSFSMGIAGSDFSAHRDFSLAAEQQRRLMQDLISHDLIHHADVLDHQHFTYKADSTLWKQIPPFDYRLPTMEAVLPANIRSLGILSLALLVSFVLALASVPRRA
ncbi:MAG: DUF3526 domain-containing protein [Acidithiobacillus sp.]|nr:DUF3526 domain-containing protein [Acidithiobacillus sp.]